MTHVEILDAARDRAGGYEPRRADRPRVLRMVFEAR